MSTSRSSAVKFAALALVLVSLLAVLAPLLPRAYADETAGHLPSVPLSYAAGASKLYLPLVVKGGSQPGPGATNTPLPQPGATNTPTTTPGGSMGNFFLPWHIGGSGTATNGPSVAVDARGGVHVAYHAYTTDGNGKKPAYYVYCASNCSNPASFSAPVSLGDKVDHVNLALDSSGRPRILWMGIDLSSQKLQAYYYATCDSSCTNGAKWSVTRVLGTDTVLAHNSRFFALDPQGRPRFIFYEDWCDANCPVNKGTFLIYCNSNCASTGSWYKSQIASEKEFDLVSLAITSTGEPRVVAAYYDTSGSSTVQYAIYLECNVDCATVTPYVGFNIHAPVLSDDPGGAFRLALDSSNRPRIALYTGALPSGSALSANQLYYLWCDATCSTPGSWDGYPLSTPIGVGTYVDLALGPQSRPRLAYEDVTKGLVYAWCTANCESGTATWQTKLVDSSDALDASDPIPPTAPCQVASWFTGKHTSLAFDSAGNPRIASDAEHWQGLDPVSNPPGSPGCPTVKMDQINARIAVLNQP